MSRSSPACRAPIAPPDGFRVAPPSRNLPYSCLRPPRGGSLRPRMRRIIHPDDYSMSFGDHLEELRRRLLLALAVPLVLLVVTFFLGDPLIQWLYRPLDDVLAAYDLPRRLQVLGPAEMLMVQLK